MEKGLENPCKRLGGWGTMSPQGFEARGDVNKELWKLKIGVFLNFENLIGRRGVCSWLLLGLGSLAMLWKSFLLNLEPNGEGIREYGA